MTVELTVQQCIGVSMYFSDKIFQIRQISRFITLCVFGKVSVGDSLRLIGFIQWILTLERTVSRPPSVLGKWAIIIIIINKS
jgi:hypothetical protein